MRLLISLRLKKRGKSRCSSGWFFFRRGLVSCSFRFMMFALSWCGMGTSGTGRRKTKFRKFKSDGRHGVILTWRIGQLTNTDAHSEQQGRWWYGVNAIAWCEWVHFTYRFISDCLWNFKENSPCCRNRLYSWVSCRNQTCCLSPQLVPPVIFQCLCTSTFLQIFPPKIRIQNLNENT